MNILNRIVDFLMTILNVADFVRLYGERQTRRLIRLEVQISFTMTGLFIFGMAMGWEVLAVSSAFFTAILGIVIWKQTEIFVNMLCALSGIKLEINNAVLEIMLKPLTKTIELGQKVVNPIAESMKKLFLPLITTSLAISFLASYIALKGLDNFNLYDLMIYSTVILFVAIFFWAYLETKKKWAGKVMFVWLLWLIASCYLWQIQCQELLETAENYTIGWAVGKAKESRKETIINITAGTPLYQYDHGKIRFYKVTEKNTRAKIIGRKKSPISKETMLEVIERVGNMDNFIGGDIFLVSAGLALTESEEKTFGPKTDFVLKKGDVYTYKLGRNSATPWIRVPKGVSADIAKKNFRVYYSNGHQPVDVGEEDVILPDVSPTIIRVGSHVPDNTITITGM